MPDKAEDPAQLQVTEIPVQLVLHPGLSALHREDGIAYRTELYNKQNYTIQDHQDSNTRLQITRNLLAACRSCLLPQQTQLTDLRMQSASQFLDTKIRSNIPLQQTWKYFQGNHCRQITTPVTTRAYPRTNRMPRQLLD